MKSSVICTIHEIKKDEIRGAYSTHGEMRNVYKTIVGKPEGKRPLRKPRLRFYSILRYKGKGSFKF
jgi:hypothetical protein